MAARTKTYVYTNPRDIDGTPYEVAAAAGAQTVASLDLALKAVDDFYVIARLAEMERQLLDGDEVDELAWRNSAQAERITLVKQGLQGAGRFIKAAASAAAYDPKHPPRAD